MAPRSAQPFALSCRGGRSWGDNSAEQAVPVNTAVPVEVETDEFAGKVLVIHETGNEPAAQGEWGGGAVDPGDLRGVVLQLQGRFKRPCGSLWVGGELEKTPQLGWLASKIAAAVMQFIRAITRGQAHTHLGSQEERPHLAFPAGQVFTVKATPPGQRPPALGTSEVWDLQWQGPGPVAVDTEHTYTFVYRTPWLDLCTWEVLKVPAISPLPIDSVLRGVLEARLLFYDLDAAGSHAQCREGSLLEIVFLRGVPSMPRAAAPAIVAVPQILRGESVLEAWAADHPNAFASAVDGADKDVLVRA